MRAPVPSAKVPEMVLSPAPTPPSVRPKFAAVTLPVISRSLEELLLKVEAAESTRLKSLPTAPKVTDPAPASTASPVALAPRVSVPVPAVPLVPPSSVTVPAPTKFNARAVLPEFRYAKVPVARLKVPPFVGLGAADDTQLAGFVQSRSFEPFQVAARTGKSAAKNASSDQRATKRVNRGEMRKTCWGPCSTQASTTAEFAMEGKTCPIQDGSSARKRLRTLPPAARICARKRALSKGVRPPSAPCKIRRRNDLAPRGGRVSRLGWSGDGTGWTSIQGGWHRGWITNRLC